MAALPYMPLFVADYLADTAHLTAAQHGAYLLLIMNYWQRGAPLPNDDARLASIARMTKRDWAHNRAAILEFFSEQENMLVHHRIQHELSRVEAKSLKSKKAAQASVQRRFGERSTDGERPLNHTDKIREDTVAKATAASGDSDKAFWDNAKAYLGPKKASMIGQWVRDFGKPATAAAITAAQVDRAVDPVPFIQAHFRKARAQPAVPL